ncbi:MAG: FixH family protein [Rhodospirillales bacterium]
MNEKPVRRITGRMVLIGFIAFFGVIAAVNGLFMYFALSTWPGLTTDDAYKKGIDYNRTLNEAARQKAVGWQSGIVIDAIGKLTVTLTDKNRQPLQGAIVSLSLTRPLGDARAYSVMLEENAAGQYAGTFTEPQPGRWIASVSAQLNGFSYQMNHEVLVQQ